MANGRYRDTAPYPTRDAAAWIRIGADLTALLSAIARIPRDALHPLDALPSYRLTVGDSPINADLSPRILDA